MPSGHGDSRRSAIRPGARPWPATMDNVSNNRRLASAKSGRHLAAVPDQQPAMWATEDLQRLASLRQLAADTGAPQEALRLIDKADNADEALAALHLAGLMPSEEESVEGMLSWFSPLLEPGCDQLDAEICAAEFIGAIRRAAPGADVVPDILCGAIEDVAERARPEATAMLRALSVIGPDESRAVAARAAARRANEGVPDPPWAGGLGAPAPGRAFSYADIYGEQQSLVLTFAYGRKRHAVVVLIDFLLGGGIKDCYVVDYTDALRTEYRRIGREPDLKFTDLDQRQAALVLFKALSAAPCPHEPDQADSVDNYIEVVRARADLMAAAILSGQAGPRPRTAAAAATGSRAAASPPGTTRSPATPGSPARRSRGPKNMHRIKVTLRGGKPPIWRRFEVPSDISLKRLHEVIQAGFGWENYHLFVFETPQGRYGIPDPDGELDHRNAANKKLSAVADWPGDKLRYDYDFGDGWEHDIVVEAVEPAKPGVEYPRCTAGKRAGPPEDCGGIGGYADLLGVLADARHPEHRPRLDWLGLASAADFDAEHFSVAEVNDSLAHLTKVLIRP